MPSRSGLRPVSNPAPSEGRQDGLRHRPAQQLRHRMPLYSTSVARNGPDRPRSPRRRAVRTPAGPYRRASRRTRSGLGRAAGGSSRAGWNYSERGSRCCSRSTMRPAMCRTRCFARPKTLAATSRCWSRSSCAVACSLRSTPTATASSRRLPDERADVRRASSRGRSGSWGSPRCSPARRRPRGAWSALPARSRTGS